MHQTLIIEDDTLMKHALPSFALTLENGFVVIGTAESYAGASQLLEQNRVDLAVVDIGLKKSPVDGIEIVRRIKNRWPYVKCVIYTGQSDEKQVAAYRAGADGWLTKGDSLAHVVDALQRAMKGEKIWDEELLERIFQLDSEGRSGSLAELSRRERELLEHLRTTATPDRIAETMGISRKTVYNLAGRIREKFDLEGGLTELRLKAADLLARG